MTIPDTVQAHVSGASVTLTGTVDTAEQRQRIAEAMRQQVGVLSVVNTIAVRPTVSSKEVKAKITEALHWLVQLEAERIWVETQDGTAILHGHLHSQEDVEAAEQAARQVPGIERVDSRLVVMP